jgi:hypothetical protein
LALLAENHSLRVVRADVGFFDQQLLGFLERRGLHYVVVARLTRWLKREAAQIPQWRQSAPRLEESSSRCPATPSARSSPI